MKYFPSSDSSKLPLFSGISTFMKLPTVKTMENVDFIVAGIPFDDSGQSFRSGARFGPRAIRDSSAFIRSSSPYHNIGLFDYVSGVDYGDIPTVPGSVHETYDSIEKELTPIFVNEIIPIIMGGDHSITLGELRAAAKKHGKVALLHFDSHSDTWDTTFGQKYTHATPFRRAVEEGLVDTSHSIQIGMRGSSRDPNDLNVAKELGYEVVTTDEILQIGFKKLVEQVKRRVKNKPVFLTFDIDFIDPAFAPGTGTPEVGGISSREAIWVLRQLVGLNLIGADLVEVSPAYDSGEITSYLAANLMFEMISLIAKEKAMKQNV